MSEFLNIKAEVDDIELYRNSNNQFRLRITYAVTCKNQSKEKYTINGIIVPTLYNGNLIIETIPENCSSKNGMFYAEPTSWIKTNYGNLRFEGWIDGYTPEDECKEMTLNEIETILGYKVKLVAND